MTPPQESIASVTADHEGMLSVYRTMLLIRRTEEQLAKSHQAGLVHGACHTYVGEEAIAAGVCAHLNQDDVVFSTHRGHGHALAKGVTPGALMAELYGRATGCSRGRGGSMHLFAPETGMMGTSGIVGPSILQAAGAGYSFKLLKSSRVAVAFFGDGAVNNGAFHEGLNMASIWKLPTLFICENNQFATEVPFEYSSGQPDVGNRGDAYGIPSEIVDGNDAVAVAAAVKTAVERARNGGGPTLIECKTYRTRPHAEGMGDFTYRTREDVEAWKARCPIVRLREALEGGGVETATLTAVEDEVNAIVNAAHQEAEQAEWPEPSSATDHVYYSGGLTTDVPVSSTIPDSGRSLNYVQATHEALSEVMARFPNAFVMGEGIGIRGGNFGTTKGLYEKYGAQRLCDTPICERGFIGLGCGAAMTGTRPVLDFMFADFILDATGEVINQIAKIQYMSSGRLAMPLVMRGCIGIGHSAATHHSGNYYALYAQVPGLRVVLPSSPYDAKGLMMNALLGNDPVVFLEHRELLAVKGPVPEEPYRIEFGKAARCREGSDVTLVGFALMVAKALEAATELAKEGISAEVIDPRTVAPLDTETILESVTKTGRLLIVEEAGPPNGLAGEVTSVIADRGFDQLDAPIRRVTGAAAPTPYSPPLEAAVVPTVRDIVRAARELVNE